MRLRSISLHVLAQSDHCTQLDTCKNEFRVASERDCSELLMIHRKYNANDINYETEAGKQHEQKLPVVNIYDYGSFLLSLDLEFDVCL